MPTRFPPGRRSNGRAPAQRGQAVRTRTTRPASPRAAVDNALAVLTADHERVTELFGRVAKLKSNGPQKAQLVERICDDLELHARVEEELFYPSLREVFADGELLDEAAVEHDSAKALIDQLRGMKPGDTRYDATVTVLCEYVKHHVKEEQEVMFPKVRGTDLDLVALGRAIKTRKRQLKGEARAQGLLGLGAFPGMMIL